MFDSRVFNVPESDVVNTFLWRAKDWERNSLQMYARSKFSHNELHGKNTSQIHNMLHSIGCNWTTDLHGVERNGVFIYKCPDRGNTVVDNILPTYESINSIVKNLI